MCVSLDGNMMSKFSGLKNHHFIVGLIDGIDSWDFPDFHGGNHHGTREAVATMTSRENLDGFVFLVSHSQ
jgi:hypothetical protein